MDAVNFLNVEYIFLRIYDLFQGFSYIALLNLIIHIIQAIAPYAIIFIIIMLGVIVYTQREIRKIEKEKHKRYLPLAEEKVAAMPEQDLDLHNKWQRVQSHINSVNPSDWRLAIIEADIMLGEILDKRGYQGDTIGDKLKGVDKSDFLTIDAAWEAHRTRNQVAHEGSDFPLSERDARRTIELFKKVFEEFYHIN